MPKSPKSTRRFWHEGKDHIRAKAIIREVAKKYGCGCMEEERYPVDLHDILPELWPRRSLRGYQADLLITKRKGKKIYQVIAEIDGEYHDDAVRMIRDAIRDSAIPKVYGIQVVRFEKTKLLKGGYSEETIAEMLGLV